MTGATLTGGRRGAGAIAVDTWWMTARRRSDSESSAAFPVASTSR